MRRSWTIQRAVDGTSGTAAKAVRLWFGISLARITHAAGVTPAALKAWEAGSQSAQHVPKVTREAIGKALRAAVADECLATAYALVGDTDPRFKALRVVRQRARHAEGDPNHRFGTSGVVLIDEDTGEEIRRT